MLSEELILYPFFCFLVATNLFIIPHYNFLSCNINWHYFFVWNFMKLNFHFQHILVFSRRRIDWSFNYLWVELDKTVTEELLSSSLRTKTMVVGRHNILYRVSQDSMDYILCTAPCLLLAFYCLLTSFENWGFLNIFEFRHI